LVYFAELIQLSPALELEKTENQVKTLNAENMDGLTVG
jgi:hypothetical protein